MIKALIIDDEPLARNLVKEYLAPYKDFTIVQECDNGLEGIKAIQSHQPELVFLDIQMPKINGFEMLELIENPPPIIFTTAFDEYAMKAFDHHATDYLLKPFSRERFDKAIEKWRLQYSGRQNNTAPADLLETAAKSPQQRERIVVKSGSSVIIIPADDIHFLEAADDFVKIHTAKGNWLKNRTLAHFEHTLDPAQFIRTHRSYMVNLSQITKLEPYEKESYVLILKSGIKVPVSKSGMARLKEILK